MQFTNVVDFASQRQTAFGGLTPHGLPLTSGERVVDLVSRKALAAGECLKKHNEITRS